MVRTEKIRREIIKTRIYSVYLLFLYRNSGARDDVAPHTSNKAALG